MACCKCCCENGTPPGECCGSPSTCCKEPDICCGPSGSKTCCEDPRVCCGVGSGQECCPEGDECCGEECCPPSQACCDDVCCNEGQYCCDGVCQDGPCEECETDEDCPSRCPDGLVPIVDGDVIVCCPPGHTIDGETGDCRAPGFEGECGAGDENCPPSFTQIPSYCCDNQCEEDPCDP